MYTSSGLIDLYERSHRSLLMLLEHCRQLKTSDINTELEGFGCPTIRLQLHHAIGGERYWMGVLEGRIDAEDDEAEFPSIERLMDLLHKVRTASASYLSSASDGELSTERAMMTWGNQERTLTPAHVTMRVLTHYYFHMGQVAAMCRILGKRCGGLDFPLMLPEQGTGTQQ